jgi:lysophospholipase L1-like esterase
VKNSKPVALKTNSSGIASHSFKIPENSKPDQEKISVFNPESSQGRQLLIDIVSPAEYNTMARIAQSMKNPSRPTTVLVIGDSLSDLFRGHNYVDKLNYWCELNSPGKLSFRNYGVRGDYITRVLRGWLRYKSILSPKPDVVLIFLGQNDSRLLKRSHFKVPKVTLEDFQTEYLQLISILRKNNQKVNIVILTPVSIYEQAVKEKWNKRKRSYDLFGDPATMLKFKAAVNAIAEKAGCGVIDVFTPTHNAANRKDLFISDGVHLSDEGNNLVAKEIMKYFTSNQWNKN